MNWTAAFISQRLGFALFPRLSCGLNAYAMTEFRIQHCSTAAPQARRDGQLAQRGELHPK
jgi:hypothetical protein